MLTSKRASPNTPPAISIFVLFKTSSPFTSELQVGVAQGHFFAALKRVKLVPDDADWQAVRYSRCGRTDKGVSALGQARAACHTTGTAFVPKIIP